MSITFDAYAAYYDLCNRGKNYDQEARFVDQLLKTNGVCSGDRILELGSGTGLHAFAFSDLGYMVDGIDLSASMTEIANSRIDNKESRGLTFQVGDARKYRGQHKYNAVISLFHVASYQTDNYDFRAMIDTAAFHLNSGGVFIFDCWYGPGVLTDPPVVRVKTLDDQKLKVVRIAEPVMNPNLNLVNVHYKIWVTQKEVNATTEFEEVHKMRYFFYPELVEIFAGAGFTLAEPIDCRSGHVAGFESWTATFIAIKK